MSESANSRQVGGDHYFSKEGPQHWDYVISALDNRYLEGNLTKYVARHRKKNGLQDLKKALHYLAKLREAENDRTRRYIPTFKENVTHLFCEGAELNARECFVMHRIVWWSTKEDLDLIESVIVELYVEQELHDKKLEAIKAGGIPVQNIEDKEPHFVQASPGFDDKTMAHIKAAGFDPTGDVGHIDGPTPAYVKQDDEN